MYRAALILALGILSFSEFAQAHPPLPGHGPWFRIDVPFARLTPQRTGAASPRGAEWWSGVGIGFGTNFFGPMDFGVNVRYLRPTSSIDYQRLWETHSFLRMEPYHTSTVSPFVNLGLGIGRYDYEEPLHPFDFGPYTPSYYAWGPNGLVGVGINYQPGSWFTLSATANYEWRSYGNVFVKYQQFRPPWSLARKEDGPTYTIAARVYGIGR